LLAVAYFDGTVLLWDAARSQPAAVLKEHTISIRSVAFSPDGIRLATGNEDSTIKLWRLGRLRAR
jgi:WD40 repeat protein